MHGQGGAAVVASEGCSNVLGQSIDALKTAEDRIAVLIEKFAGNNKNRISGTGLDGPAVPPTVGITSQTMTVRNLAQRINDRISELDNLL